MGMNIKPNHPVLVSLTGLVGVLGIARFCDAVMQFIQYQNAQTFSLSHVIFWAFALIALLMAASWLLVAWQVLIRAPGNIWVSVVLYTHHSLKWF
jgi:multisubunit Na+/H+ antiporter MnhG subunit